VDISDVTFVTEDFGITACSGSFVSFNPPAYNEGALLCSSPINRYFYYWRWNVADNIQIGYSWFQRLGQGFCNSFGVLGQTHYECYDKVWRHDPYNGGWSIVDQSPISTVHPPNSSNVYCGEMGPLQRYRYHGFNLCYHAWDVFGNDTGWICFTPAGSYVYVV